MQDYTVGRQWMHLWLGVRVDLWWAVAVEAEKQIYGCEQGNNMIPTGWICFLSLWLGLGKLKRIVKVRERLWIFLDKALCLCGYASSTVNILNPPL